MTKRIARTAALALLGFLIPMMGTVSVAQLHHEIALTRAEIQSERQAIVAANLPLTEEQAKTFWPVYRDYRAALAKSGDRVVSLIESYAATQETMTDAQAQALLDEFLAIQKEENKIKTDWVPKFAKILPGKAVARFYQIENKLDILIRYELVAPIPLVDHTTKGK